MKTNRITQLILLLLLCASQALFAQDNKFTFTLEYSPNYSKLTDEWVDGKHKLSHNALLRLSYNNIGKFKPTIGISFLNTGELIKVDAYGHSGFDNLKFIYSHNYLVIPMGIKYTIGKVYVLPEVGVGINISNTTKTVTKFTNGDKKSESMNSTLNAGSFNKWSIPLSLSIGTDIDLLGMSFSTGLKGYYGLNQVIEDVPRNNHYYGIGLILAINL